MPPGFPRPEVPPALRIFCRLILRPLFSHPLLAGLNVLSIALGVAVFSSVQTANRSANSAFRSTVQLVSGSADLEIRGRIPEGYFPIIKQQEGVAEAFPTVEWIGTLPSIPGEYVRVLGMDPFRSGGLRPFSLAALDGSEPDLEKWLRDPQAVAVFANNPSHLAGKAIMNVNAPGGPVTLVPEFLIQPEDPSEEGDPRLVVMDIAWAQEHAGMTGFLTSIELHLDEGADPATVAKDLAAKIPGDLQIQTPLGRTRQTEGMLASFQLNLTALSLVSLLVGCFLIYNTVSASVLRRRTEIGILRSMGASPNLLRCLFLAEAGCSGLIGAILGLLISLPLAAGLTGLVSQTISSLYLLVSIERLDLSPLQMFGGLSLGILAAVGSAWIPASEAVRVDPREVLHPGFPVERAIPLPIKPMMVGLISLIVAIAAGWFSLANSMGAPGFLSAFLVLAGFSLCVPIVCRGFSWMAGKLIPAHFFTVTLAVRNLTRALFRNSVTIAALASAVAMLVSISVMIYSFRGSVVQWMERTLVADVFVTPAANQIAGLQQDLHPALLKWLQQQPNVELVSGYLEVPILFQSRNTYLGVFSGRARGDLDFVEKDAAARPAKLADPGMVAVSESFGVRFSVRAGDTISLPMPSGSEEFEVVGTYRDYTRDSGTILMSVSNYLQHGGVERFQSAAIYLRESSDAKELMEKIREQAQGEVPLSVLGNRELRDRIAEIFDQTFAITGVLRLIAIVVAVSGVLLGLGILVNERAREIGVFRALGASRGQVLITVLWEAAAIGGIASFVGLFAGFSLSVVLTYVINKAYFGWTVDLGFPFAFLLWIPVWVTATAVVAAIWPAWRAAGIPPAEAVRYE